MRKISKFNKRGEEMKALVEMNNKLKAKLEKQTKVYQQSLQEMQREIYDLERNCDVFNEQMNDAVERATELQIENNKLKQEKQELIEWLKEEIKNCNPNPELYFKVGEGFKSKFFQEVLLRLGE